MLRQAVGIVDPELQHGGDHVFLRLHHADHGHVLAFADNLFHIVFIPGFVGPQVIFLIVDIEVAGIDQLESDADQIRVFIGVFLGVDLILPAGEEVVHQLVELCGIPQPHGIGCHIGQSPPGGKHHDTLVVILRPASGHHIILIPIEALVLRHLKEHIRTGHGGHNAAQSLRVAKPQSGEGLIRIDLADLAVALLIQKRRHAVTVLDGACHLIHTALRAVDKGL